MTGNVLRQLGRETAEKLAALWASDKPPSTMFGNPSKPLADTPYGPPAPDGMTNPYWDIVRQLPIDGLPPCQHDVDAWGNGLVGRADLTYTYSFAVPSPTDIAFLAEQLDGRP